MQYEITKIKNAVFIDLKASVNLLWKYSILIVQALWQW